MSEPAPKRKGVSLGEVIALLALIVSAAGLYLAWQNSGGGPTEIVEKKPAVPLVLRGAVEDDGRTLTIAPVEASHALDSLALRITGGKTLTTGGDGQLSASEIEGALPAGGDRKGAGSARVTIDARYVENGKDRRSNRSYVIRYRWEGGGLFDDRDLRLTGFSRG